MKSHCSLIVTIGIVFGLNASSVVAQEAIEEKPSASIEESPSPTLEEKAAEEKPAKRTKRKAGEERSGKVLQDTMTAEEFRAAGLEKLSAEELRNLNAWLQGYRQTAETKAAEKATAEVTQKAAAQSRAKMDLIVSRVDGNFTGLTGHTVIKLEDGTTWKQAMPDDHYRAQITDHPGAAVIHGVFGYKMRIAGTPEFYVDPVRK